MILMISSASTPITVSRPAWWSPRVMRLKGAAIQAPDAFSRIALYVQLTGEGVAGDELRASAAFAVHNEYAGQQL